MIKCPECGITMEEIYGSKYETYYECIECGYGELREKSEYTYEKFLEDDIYDDEEYDIEEADFQDIGEDGGFDY